MKKKLLSAMMVVAMVATMLVGCGSSAPAADDSANTGAAVEDTADNTSSDALPGEGKKVGFVTFGLGGDFFPMLADQFVTTFEEAGYEASYADGQFDPTAQMDAAENYIAQGVDVLFVWSVAPEAMAPIVEKCEAAGIKFVAFVAPTEKYDALMVSDDAKLADYCCKLAAKWIDEKFADADDHSVPVVVLSERSANTGVIQADELIKIEEFSKKAKFVEEVACQNEKAEDGQQAAENIFTKNPDVKVILTAHSALAQGANSYLTSLSSPITDYSDMGIFAINGDSAMAETIKSSVNDESPLRGMVLTGSVADTANEMLFVCNGILDGSLPTGHLQEAGTIFVYADTVDEYLDSQTVTSVTNKDFD